MKEISLICGLLTHYTCSRKNPRLYEQYTWLPPTPPGGPPPVGGGVTTYTARKVAGFSGYMDSV